MPQLPHAPQPATVLVVGSTGLLGGEIIQQLRHAGRGVRALTRPSSDATKVTLIQRVGAQCILGDLKIPASLEAACEGVRTVVSTATALLSRTEGDSIESVDLRGQLDLVAAAERAGVDHFVFISFPPIAIDFAFQRAKRAVEARLQQSSMSFTIIHAASFCEIWLSPLVGFAPLQGHARIFGAGKSATSWISLVDVARFVVAAVEGGPFARKTLKLGGPDALSYHDILDLFAIHGAAAVASEHVPELELEKQLHAATGPSEEALAAFMLATARGQIVSSDEARDLWSGPFTRMSDYVARVAAGAGTA